MSVQSSRFFVCFAANGTIAGNESYILVAIHFKVVFSRRAPVSRWPWGAFTSVQIAIHRFPTERRPAHFIGDISKNAECDLLGTFSETCLTASTINGGYSTHTRIPEYAKAAAMVLSYQRHGGSEQFFDQKRDITIVVVHRNKDSEGMGKGIPKTENESTTGSYCPKSLRQSFCFLLPDCRKKLRQVRLRGKPTWGTKRGGTNMEQWNCTTRSRASTMEFL